MKKYCQANNVDIFVNVNESIENTNYFIKFKSVR